MDNVIVCMKNRSRVDLIATMLRSAKSGASRSRIMYATFISHKQLMDYLAFMQRNKLIEIDEKTNHIYPTEKGHAWLITYEKLMSMTSDIIEDEIKSRLKQAKIK